MRRPAAVFLALALLSGPAAAAPLAAPALRQATDPLIVQAQDEGLLPPADVAPEPGQQDLQLIQSDTTVSDLMARVQRLEASNRQLTGQLEETMNLLRRSQEDFKRYRDDTEFRLQALEGGSGAKPAPKKSSEAAPPPPVAPTPKAAALAPKNLGSVAVEPDAPLLDDPSQGAAPAPAPLAPAPKPVRPVSPTAPPGVPGIAVDTNEPPPAAPQPQVAAVNPAPAAPAAPAAPPTSEDEYTADYRLIESQSYEAAELAFRKFIASYPKDKRVADATHWIGESLYQRQQYRDAAEQFLKVTTTYGNTRRAPSSMLRLGMSLAALGEKDAACATLQEVTRKYPNAPATVKSGVDRETKKNSCPAQ